MNKDMFRKRIKIHQVSEVEPLVYLDASKLGKPWHKLPALLNDNFEILDAKLSIYFLKKLRVNVSLASLNFSSGKGQRPAQVYSTGYGHVGFDIERPLLLRILNDYYGLNDGTQNSSSPGHEQAGIALPVTKTEERLKNKIAQDIISLVLDNTLIGVDIQPEQDHGAIIHQWAGCIQLEMDGYQQGCFSLLLDNTLVDRLLQRLRNGSVSESPDAVPRPPAALEHLVSHMPVRLNGKLTGMTLTVAQLAEIRPGDIIPIALNEPVPVFVNKAQILTASIAQERGKLFFCDFNDNLIEKHHD
ncbi:FliM/FliN family flagellar motor switch protein [Mangrovibacter plantisponsor]|uniref:Flagellar motor switch protein FliM n=1 Tax=Mangrovibacter plantisponsor TaxID=451513 RepID=A0A317PJP0_9ENTR|nr:FliM/FliN family flagellar motor switch protein [Mangrovibacter plantisponsor]PWW00837.1 flagellar motor switch protein FliM [Mangrovibacter plantisponsor]